MNLWDASSGVETEPALQELELSLLTLAEAITRMEATLADQAEQILALRLGSSL